MQLVAELVRRRVSRNVFAIVDLQAGPLLSHEAVEDALCSLPNVKGCLRASSETSVFLQIVDVLLGCLQFDWNDAYERYDPGSKRANAKRQLARFIKASLGIPPGRPILTTATPYRRWSKKSIFTATLWRAPGSNRKRAAMSGDAPANGTA